MMDPQPRWQCCFCAEPITTVGEDVLITLLAAPDDRESSQEMHCHRDCLRSRVLPGVAML